MKTKVTLLVFSLSLMLAAGLLFSLQPMIGKQLLPKAGGSQQVWNVAMAFFQIALLAGYFLTHALGRLRPRLHGAAYIALLAVAGAGFLPVLVPAGWAPQANADPALSVLLLLVLQVAVPFIALSLSAPTLQRLFSASSHDRAADPYFLYAASNFGSFIGLLAYPLLLEPNLPVIRQAQFWQAGYWLLSALAVLCLLLLPAHGASEAVTKATPARWKQRLRWAVLALVPSSLTLGVTTHITTDLTPAPLLWVITLGLYLLSYIVAFAHAGAGLRRLNLQLFPVLAMMTALLALVHVNLPFAMMLLALVAFFSTALGCHTLLANERPAANQLTDYYLWLSVGGAIGGSFNAFAAPLLFNRPLEYPLMLLAGIALAGTTPQLARNPKAVIRLAILIVALSIAILALQQAKDSVALEWRQLVFIAFFGAVTPLLRIRKILLALAGVLFVGLLLFKPLYTHTLYQVRNFYGTMRVAERVDSDSGYTFRLLEHGTTTHGVQMVSPRIGLTPTGYYAPTGPMALIWQLRQPQSVAVVGLGAGSLNCYAKPGQRVHFIEIDPDVVHIARNHFTFLSGCPEPEISIGDGRLVLAADPRRYDLLIVDAFSSDSIPLHLLTREAVALYMSRLTPGGILAIHVSNRFFNLEPVLAAIASELGLTGYYGEDARINMVNGVMTFPSKAVVLAQDAVTLRPLSYQLNTWRKLQPVAGFASWSDDYSNAVQALKFFSPSADRN